MASKSSGVERRHVSTIPTEPYDQDGDPSNDPETCPLCNQLGTTPIIVDGVVFKMCGFDAVEVTKTLLEIQKIPARAKR
jgi:hypothetical protein